MQVPEAHTSDLVQALPSLHDVPSAADGFEQTPVAELHVPAAWHWSLAEQITGFDPVHVPDWHESVCVQTFPSLQLVPFAATGFEHTPVAWLQTPTVWH
jgi:hypothetical protein